MSHRRAGNFAGDIAIPPLSVSYDQALIALSLVVSFLTAFTALHVAARIVPARGQVRTAWVAISAVVLGGGVWSMHFLATLATAINQPITFDGRLMALAFLAGAGAMALGLHIAAQRRVDSYRLLAAGTVIGLGIAGTHFLGMEAVYSGAVVLLPGYPLASAIVAIAGSVGALMLARGTPSLWRRAGAAAVLAAVIGATDLVETAAAHLLPQPEAVVPRIGINIWRDWLATAIGAGTLIVLGVAMIAAFIDRHFARLAAEKDQALHESEQRFRMISEMLPIPVAVTRAADGTVLFSNSRSREQFRLPADRVPVRRTSELFVDPVERRYVAEMLRDEGRIENVEVQMRRYDGTIFWSLLSATATTLNGEPVVLSGYYDITDRKATESALIASEARYALISRATNDGIWDWDIATGTVFFSDRWKEVLGLPAEAPVSRLDDWFALVLEDDRAVLKRAFDDHVAGRTQQIDIEYRMRHAAGHVRWLACRGLAERDADGTAVRVAGSQADVTLRKSYEQKLLNAAYEDHLTGLKSRAAVIERLEEAPEATGAVAILALDRFRQVTEAVGSRTGDALLVAVAGRLRAVAEVGDLVARSGGAEFLIWRPGAQTMEDARRLADAMHTALVTPLSVDRREIPVRAATGAALQTPPHRTGAELVRNARLALRRAREHAVNAVELFDQHLFEETALHERLASELTLAQVLGQIGFHYQPLVTCCDGTLAGFEALMRWQHPELGMVPPVRFIPIAEETGLIVSLGQHAIESAARQIGLWSSSALIDPDVTVAVNLSPRQIADPLAADHLCRTIRDLPLPAERLKLEITESVLMSDPEAAIALLGRLRGMGVQLSLDDFGTGYSSLSYLHRFPMDMLKIDRSFVNRMTSSAEAFRLVRAIIELSHDLHLRVVAEGVETADEARQLNELGCDYGQGYFYARPMAPTDMAVRLAAGFGAPASRDQRIKA